MLWTLQWYIFRHMAKTFGLTAIGLTAVLCLGGGVFNMVQLEQVTAGQVGRIMLLVLPVVAAIAMPVAALFSAAATYGRLAADNEFVACRSSGINIHHLFLPALMISLISASFTFVAINFMIPSLIRRLSQIGRHEVQRLVENRLKAPERLVLADRYVIYADQTRAAPVDTPGAESTSRLWLNGVAFVELGDESWKRYGTAEAIDIRFGLDGDLPTVEADMRGVTLFDEVEGRFSDVTNQRVERYRIPLRLGLKVRTLGWGALRHYGRRPQEFPRLQRELQTLRAGIGRELFYRDLGQQFQQRGGTIQLADDDTSYTLQAESYTPQVADGRPIFSNVRVVETRGEHLRDATAQEAALVVQRDAAQTVGRVQLYLSGNVELNDSRDPGHTLRRHSEKLHPIRLPLNVVEQARREFPDTRLLDPGIEIPLGKWVTSKRAEILDECRKLAREIRAVIHSRFAFSVSVLLLVTLTAALGIIYRGTHLLTAFGISFAPSVVVVISIITGRHLAENAGTAAAGLSLIWTGIVFVAGLDVVALNYKLRR